MDNYQCTIGCRTCNYAPEGVYFYKKEYALALIFHKELIGDDTDRYVKVRVDDEGNAFAAFFEEHQTHDLVLVDKDGIHTPSLDDIPVTGVTYHRINRQN